MHGYTGNQWHLTLIHQISVCLFVCLFVDLLFFWLRILFFWLRRSTFPNGSLQSMQFQLLEFPELSKDAQSEPTTPYNFRMSTYCIRICITIVHACHFQPTQRAYTRVCIAILYTCMHCDSACLSLSATTQRAYTRVCIAILYTCMHCDSACLSLSATTQRAYTRVCIAILYTCMHCDSACLSLSATTQWLPHPWCSITPHRTTIGLQPSHVTTFTKLKLLWVRNICSFSMANTLCTSFVAIQGRVILSIANPSTCDPSTCDPSTCDPSTCDPSTRDTVLQSLSHMLGLIWCAVPTSCLSSAQLSQLGVCD